MKRLHFAARHLVTASTAPIAASLMLSVGVITSIHLTELPLKVHQIATSPRKVHFLLMPVSDVKPQRRAEMTTNTLYVLDEMRIDLHRLALDLVKQYRGSGEYCRFFEYGCRPFGCADQVTQFIQPKLNVVHKASFSLLESHSATTKKERQISEFLPQQVIAASRFCALISPNQ